jgi:hypothetical protein
VVAGWATVGGEQVFAVVLSSWLAFGPSRARYAAIGVLDELGVAPGYTTSRVGFAIPVKRVDRFVHFDRVADHAAERLVHVGDERDALGSLRADGEAKAHLECVVHQIVHVGEGALAANLGLSRTSLREAVRALTVLGVIAVVLVGRARPGRYPRTSKRVRMPLA